MTAQRRMLDSSDLLNQSARLRQRLRDEGYLYLRGVLPVEPLLALRQAILEICRDHGWLAAGTDTMDGIASPTTQPKEPEPAFMEVYRELQRLESFHRLAIQPECLRLFDEIYGEPALAHPRNIARIKFPDAAHASTFPHQDYVYIQGNDRVNTLWIPIGDCPRELGGLSVLPYSHIQGILETRWVDDRKKKSQVVLEKLPHQEWVTADYQLGDAVVIDNFTVHQGNPNQSGNRLRLSCDFRYQPVSQPIVPESLQVHHNLMPWEEVYRDWASDEDQYYWRRFDLRLVDYDPALTKPIVR